jgi:hypothetical protein
MWRGDGWIDGVYKYGAVRFGTEAEEGKVFESPGISIEYDFIAKLPTSAKASFIIHVEDQ